MLEGVRREFDHLVKESDKLKIIKEEYETKLKMQLLELTAFQQHLIDLENSHQNMKALYEDEISNLKKEIAMRSGNAVSANCDKQASSFPVGAVPPTLTYPSGGFTTGGMFGDITEDTKRQKQAHRSDASHISKRLRLYQGVPLNQEAVNSQFSSHQPDKLDEGQIIADPGTDNYVQSQSQSQSQSHHPLPQPQLQPQTFTSRPQTQNQPQAQYQSQTQSQPHPQPQPQSELKLQQQL